MPIVDAYVRYTQHPAVLIAVPLAISLALTKLTIVVSHRYNLMAQPTEDRWHKSPTPIFGGIAMYVAFVSGMFLFGREILVQDWRMIGLLVGATIMFVSGLVDDVWTLKPYVKLMFQLLAVVVAVSTGLYFHLFGPLLGVPLSAFWIIGITNAFNFLDGMDGMAAGVASIVCLNVFLFDFLGGWTIISLPALILMGAMLGFLVFNFNPAKIFMGDTGSLMIGYTLATVTIIGSNRDVSNLAITILFPLLIMTVPIFDTTLVTVLRSLAGRKLSQGGKDHTMHRLAQLGLSERNTVLLIWAISLLSGGLVIAYNLMPRLVLVVVAVLLWAALYYFGMFLAQVNVYTHGMEGLGRRMIRLPGRILRVVILNRMPSTQLLVDFLLVGVAILSGYLIKYDGRIPAWHVRTIVYAFPILAVGKIATLHAFGLYRQIWRYLSYRDLWSLFGACTLGSLLSMAVIVLLNRFIGFSRAIFFIDWLFFFGLVVASRVAIRTLRDSFLRGRPQGSEVVIYGAGDSGNRLLDELYTNKLYDFRPVAFFDADPVKHGKTIQGVPVAGGLEKMTEFVASHGVRQVVLAVPTATREDLAPVYSLCEEKGLRVFRYEPARIFKVERAADPAGV